MTQGRVLRSVGLELRGSSAAFTLREADTFRGSLVASMVLSTPGCEPLSVWAELLTGPSLEEAISSSTGTAVAFQASGVRVSDVCSAVLPWTPGEMGRPWDDVPGWAAFLAERHMGHPEAAAREAAAFFSGMVLAAVSDAWAASLVRRACAMVAPGRVVELAREACVEQVMEG